MMDAEKDGLDSGSDKEIPAETEPAATRRKPAQHLTMNPDAERIAKVTPIGYSHQAVGKHTVPPDSSRLQAPTSFPAPPPGNEDLQLPLQSLPWGWKLAVALVFGGLLAWACNVFFF